MTLAVLEQILALHPPVQDGDQTHCRVCTDPDDALLYAVYPCPTVQAVDAAAPCPESAEPRREDDMASERWLVLAVDLHWILGRALARQGFRGRPQTLAVVDWASGYPKWSISDE